MLIIFLASSIPGKLVNSVGLGKESYHINGHFFLFFVLCIAYYKATKSIIKSIIFTFLYGILDEIHQIFIPLRSASFFDIFVDTAGGLLAGGLLWKLQHLLPKKLKNWLIN
ncbi:VanZ family protein [candidate division WWE3 bacterium]|uniref:VanZ family protein n=1 Tax=candidate division WWE3 bacterium TaxID=2053526 RepID=A0A3A4ZCR7_UNCKA|nr:MAG: VanZ family protein [candidate division WWE3 bacterium]